MSFKQLIAELNYTTALFNVPLFQRLSLTELKLIAGISHAKQFKKNQIIFLEGEVFSGFYVILDGSVKVYRLGPHGEVVMQRRLSSLRSFAESALFSGSNFHSTCAQAIEDSVLLFFPKADFMSLLESNPALAIKFSGVACKVFDPGLSADERLALYILNEVQLNNSAKLPEPHFSLVIRKKELAEHLGIASGTLSRALRRLKESRIIREVSRKIFITDIKRLREVAQKRG
jgi:CRP-like cAMP-binding protein